MDVTPRKPRSGGGRAYHSVLEPHWELIRQLRRQRMTWKEIAGQLQAHHGIGVTLHAVYRFSRRRSRRPASWEDKPRPPESVSTPLSLDPTPLAPTPIQRPFLPNTSFRRPDPQQFNREDYP